MGCTFNAPNGKKLTDAELFSEYFESTKQLAKQTRTVTTTILDSFFKHNDVVTSKEFVDTLLTNPTLLSFLDKFAVDSLKFLQENFNQRLNQVPVVFKEVIAKQLDNGNIVEAAGVYSGQMDFIAMSLNPTFTPLNKKVSSTDGKNIINNIALAFIHEMMHAVTYPTIRSTSFQDTSSHPVTKKLVDLYNFVYKYYLENKQQFADTDTYGLTNITEFAAEAMSNPSFIDMLKNIPGIDEQMLDNTNAKKSTVEKIIDFILDLVAYVFKQNKAKVETRSAYEQYLQIFQEISSIHEQFLKAARYPETAMKYYMEGNKKHLTTIRQIQYAAINSETHESTLPGMTTITEAARELWSDGMLPRITNIYSVRSEIVDKIQKLSNAIQQLEDQSYSLAGKLLAKVTDEENGGFSWFKRNRKARSAQIIAENHWAGRNKDTKLGTQYGDLTMDEYAERIQQSFDKGAQRGEIIHILLDAYMKGDLSEEASKRLGELYETSGYTPSQFKWVTDNAQLILGAADVNIFDKIPDEQRDIPLSELKVANEILGLGGRIDLLVAHADGSFSLKDFKTGFSFNTDVQWDIFKYGDVGLGEDLLWDTPRNRAKLQLMLYAIMLKANNPGMKFRSLDVLWMPTSSALYSNDFRQRVQVDAFLAMIETFLKKEKPDVYEALKERLGEDAFDSLWDPKEYHTGYASKEVRRAIDEGNKNPSDLIKLKLEKLKTHVMYDLNPHSITSREGAERRALEAGELTREILELQSKVTDLDLLSWKEDLSYMSLWLGTNSTIASPYIQIYSELLTARQQRVRQRFELKYQRLLALLRPIYNSYQERRGMATVTKLTANLITRVDPEELYGFMIKERRGENGDFLGYMYRHSEEDWNEVIRDNERFGYITADNVHIYRRFADYVISSVEDFFVDKNGKKALANQVATTARVGDKFIEYTNLEVHNGAHTKLTKRRPKEKFQYYKGWMPKVPKRSDEFKTIFSSEYWKDRWNEYATYWKEDIFENRSRTDVAIPMKYIGNSKLDVDPNRYSFNVEHQFDRFVRAQIYKEEMDEVYAFGKGIQYYLEMSSNDDGDFARHIEYLDKALFMQVQGYTQRSSGENKFVSKNKYRVDFLKVLSSLKDFVAAPIMWLNWVGGTANGVFTTISTHKDGLRNSILKGESMSARTAQILARGIPFLGIGSFEGIDGNQVDFTLDDLKNAWPEVMDIAIQAMKGDIRESKAYLMLKKFGYLPDYYEWASSPSELVTAQNKVLRSSTWYMFYSLPEEMIAALTMVAQLKSMKVNNGAFKGKSLWDMYEKVELEEQGEKFKSIRWAIDPETNAPFVRGVMNYSDNPERPDYQQLTELDAKEIRRLFYVYERMHGGYRKDERTMLEYYVFGQVFMQFRRYMPNILRNALMSSGKRSSLGYYKPTGAETTEGEPVVQWQSRIMEGRWLVMGKMIQNYIGLRMAINKPETELNMFQRVWNKVTVGSNENYSWDQLDIGQKEALLDAAVTISTWAMMGAGYSMIFGGEIGDDDSWAKMYSRIMNDYSHQYNIWELSRNISNLSPVIAKKARDIIVDTTDVTLALFAYTIGDEDGAFDSQGNLRGWLRFQRDIPFLAAWRRSVYHFENVSDEWDFAVQ